MMPSMGLLEDKKPERTHGVRRQGGTGTDPCHASILVWIDFLPTRLLTSLATGKEAKYISTLSIYGFSINNCTHLGSCTATT